MIRKKWGTKKKNGKRMITLDIPDELCKNIVKIANKRKVFPSKIVVEALEVYNK